MKKLLTLLMALSISAAVFADGLKPLSLTTKPVSKTATTYAPDPSSGNVGNTLNIYAGVGSKSMTFGLDYEFPIIDPNLTLGPQVVLGLPFKRGVNMSIKGGVIARYYADWLIPNMPEQFDVFITSNTGVGLTFGSNVQVYWGTSVGGRWNFSESLSLYAQIGGGFNASNLYVGLSWKM